MGFQKAPHPRKVRFHVVKYLPDRLLNKVHVPGLRIDAQTALDYVTSDHILSGTPVVSAL